MKLCMGTVACLLTVIGGCLAKQTTKTRTNLKPSDFLMLKWADYYVSTKAHIRNQCYNDTSDAQKSEKEFMKISGIPLPFNEITMQEYMGSLISAYRNDVNQINKKIDNYIDAYVNMLDLNADRFISRDEYLEVIGCFGNTNDNIKAMFDAQGPTDGKVLVDIAKHVWYDFLTNPEPTDSAIAIAKVMLDTAGLVRAEFL